MNQHIQRTSRTFGTPPITISTSCRKESPFSVAFCASKPGNSISMPSLRVGSTALPPAKSSLLDLIRLPPWAPSHMRSLDWWDPKTAVMGSILTLWSKASEHHLTIPKTQCTAWQYTMAHGSVSSITVVTRRIYQLNNCTQWSSIFTMVSSFKFSV